MGFDLPGELEECAKLRGIPLHSGEQVIFQRQRRDDGTHVYLAAARISGCACGAAFEAQAEDLAADFEVRGRTRSNLSRNSTTPRRRMINGGSSRKMWSCVQLI